MAMIRALLMHPTFLASSTGLFASAIPLLYVLKMLQDYHELVRDHPLLDHRFARAAVDAVFLRIDNPSFWNFVGLTLTGALITRAVTAVRPHALRENSARSALTWPEPRHWSAWFGWSLILTTAYLVVVWIKGETFWYHRDPKYLEAVDLIQITEGIVNLFGILFGPLFLAVALTCLEELFVRSRLPARCEDLIEVAWAAGNLRSAGLGPLLVVLSAFFLSGPLGEAVNRHFDWLGSGPGSYTYGLAAHLLTALFLVLLYIPFLYLWYRVKDVLGDRFEFKLREIKPPPPFDRVAKAFRLGEVLTGQWYDARCIEIGSP